MQDFGSPEPEANQNLRISQIKAPQRPSFVIDAISEHDSSEKDQPAEELAQGMLLCRET